MNLPVWVKMSLIVFKDTLTLLFYAALGLFLIAGFVWALAKASLVETILGYAAAVMAAVIIVLGVLMTAIRYITGVHDQATRPVKGKKL